MSQPTLTPREQRLAFAAPNSRIGDGLLQWSRGGWFGAQLGSTLWLVLCGFAIIAHDLTTGLGILGCSLAANLVGYAFWRMRKTLAPHLAIQLMSLTSFSAAAASFAMLYKIGVPQEMEVMAVESGGGLPFPLWAYLAVFPILSVGLAFLNRSGKGAA